MGGASDALIKVHAGLKECCMQNTLSYGVVRGAVDSTHDRMKGPRDAESWTIHGRQPTITCLDSAIRFCSRHYIPHSLRLCIGMHETHVRANAELSGIIVEAHCNGALQWATA